MVQRLEDHTLPGKYCAILTLTEETYRARM